MAQAVTEMCTRRLHLPWLAKGCTILGSSANKDKELYTKL